jgi:hypothetical protein
MSLPRRDHLTGKPILAPQKTHSQKKQDRMNEHRMAQRQATRPVALVTETQAAKKAARHAETQASQPTATRPVRMRLGQGMVAEVDTPIVESRWLVNYREPSTDAPGLVQTDDGLVYLVSPDGTRALLGGGSQTLAQVLDRGNDPQGQPIQAANGGTMQAGGDVTLEGGAGDGGSVPGARISLTGGDGSNATPGHVEVFGDLQLLDGAVLTSNTSNPGTVVRGIDSSFHGGKVQVSGGTTTGDTQAGGDVELHAGSGDSEGEATQGASATLFGGAANGAGGAAIVQAGAGLMGGVAANLALDGQDTDGSGSYAGINAGSGIAGKIGGWAYVQGGDGDNGANPGARLLAQGGTLIAGGTLFAEAGTSGGSAGALFGLDGGTASLGGQGSLVGGQGGAGASGGSIRLSAGQGNGGDAAGPQITLQGGGPTTGDDGLLILTGVPTADPAVVGALYTAAGALMVSAG